jgi:hypothetical protein
VLTAPSTPLRANREIRLHVDVTNVSKIAIGLPWDKSSRAELCGFNIAVLSGPAGKPPMTKYLWLLRSSTDSREEVSNPDVELIILSNPGRLNLKPAATEHYFFILGELYEMDRPGIYVVQVDKADPITGRVVKSNPVSIRLLSD